MLIVIGTVFLVLASVCWFLCYKAITSDDCKAGIVAWLLKFPATTFTVIGVLSFIIEAVKK